jgi:transposase
MFQKNLTSKLLQLPLKKINILKCYENKDKITVRINNKYKKCICPYCQKATTKLYDNSIYVHKNIKHFITFKYEIIIEAEKRRFYCKKCKKNFHEQYEFLTYKVEKNKIRSKSYTTIFEDYMLFEWGSCTSVSEIARRCKVSEWRLWNIINNIKYEELEKKALKKLEQSEWDLFLWIDEHSFSWRDMVLVITEHSTKKVIAILEDTKHRTLKNWLNSLPPKIMIRIKGITTDMTWNYKRAVLESLWARVVNITDKFHIIQLANHVLDEIRQLNNWMIHMWHYWKKIVDIKQKKWIDKKIKRKNINEKHAKSKYRSDQVISFAKKEHLRLYEPNNPEYKPITVSQFIDEKYRMLFITWSEKLTVKQELRLNQILVEFDPEWYLFEAYDLKENIRECLNTKNAKMLDLIIKWLDWTNHYKLITFKKTLIKHREGILNYFKYWLTNARAEWKNNKAKVLKRVAYWYANKNTYMKKLLFAC